MNKIHNSNIIKLIFFSIILLLGIYLIIKPEKNISKFNIEKVSVLVVDTKKKSNSNTNKILGVILVITSVFGYLLVSKKSAPTDKKIKLTQQERKIYNFIINGDSNKEIASKLNVSVSTIKTHINNIYKKIGISSRTELIDNKDKIKY